MNPKETTGYEHVHRFLSRAAWGTTALYVVAGISLTLAVVTLGSEISQHMAAIESWIEGLGSWGVMIYVGIFVLAASFFLP